MNDMDEKKQRIRDELKSLSFFAVELEYESKKLKLQLKYAGKEDKNFLLKKRDKLQEKIDTMQERRERLREKVKEWKEGKDGKFT